MAFYAERLFNWYLHLFLIYILEKTKITASADYKHTLIHLMYPENMLFSNGIQSASITIIRKNNPALSWS